MTIDHLLSRVGRARLPLLAAMLARKKHKVYRNRGNGRVWRIHSMLDGYDSEEAAKAGWEELTSKIALMLMTED